MKILITGACGYLGSYCSELFSKQKDTEITILCRKIPNYMIEWSKKFKVINCDICDEKINEYITEKYDYVIHMAAVNENICKTNARVSVDTNVYGTKNILELCRNNKIDNFIYISTFHVYGYNGLINEIDETVVPKPLNDYGITHYLAELYCKQYSENYHMNCIVLRPSNFLSPPLFKKINRWTLVPNNFCEQIFESNSIKLKTLGTQIRNFISVYDLYNSILLVIKNKIEGFEIFNVGSDNYFSIYELACITKEVYEEIFEDEKIDIIYELNDNIKGEGINKEFKYDITKLSDIGYAVEIDVRTEIRKTIMNLKNSRYSLSDDIISID